MTEDQRLRDRIARYRDMMTSTLDPTALAAMAALCAEYEARLAEVGFDHGAQGVGDSDDGEATQSPAM
jgi:hypothetical protein